MTSSIYQMYKNLEKCTESLEEDVKFSLAQVTQERIIDQNLLALEASKDYHYKEILSHLVQIKEHIRVIAEHDDAVHAIHSKIGSGHSKIDKNYIKKQVETFQRIGAVHMRQRRPVRPPETSSMKLLECWEKMLDEQHPDTLQVKKREEAKRTKRVVSSTVDAFLEFGSDRHSLESLREDDDAAEAVNEPLVVVSEDTKPRIVEVIYKKDVDV